MIPIWNRYSTDVMVITQDLLRAELLLQSCDPDKILTDEFHWRWTHSVLTPPRGVELRILDWPGVLGWGFIRDHTFVQNFTRGRGSCGCASMHRAGW